MGMDSNKIIDDLGGTSAVAKMFGIKPPSVSQWRKTAIPNARMMFLQVKFPDVFGLKKTRSRRTKAA